MKKNLGKPMVIIILATILYGCCLVPEYDTPISKKNVKEKEKAEKALKKQQQHETSQFPHQPSSE